MLIIYCDQNDIDINDYAVLSRIRKNAMLHWILLCFKSYVIYNFIPRDEYDQYVSGKLEIYPIPEA